VRQAFSRSAFEFLSQPFFIACWRRAGPFLNRRTSAVDGFLGDSWSAALRDVRGTRVGCEIGVSGAHSAWTLLRITPFFGPRDDLLRDNHLRCALHCKARGQNWKQELVRVLHLYLDHATWVVGLCFADGEVVWRSYPCSRRRDLRWIESHARNIGHIGLNVRRTRRTATR
jgi:hypothetical protein